MIDTRAHVSKFGVSGISFPTPERIVYSQFIPQMTPPISQHPNQNTRKTNYGPIPQNPNTAPQASVEINETTFVQPINRCEASNPNASTLSTSLPNQMGNMSLQPNNHIATSQNYTLPALIDTRAHVFKFGVPGISFPTPGQRHNAQQPMVAGSAVIIPENLLEDRAGMITS